MAKRKRAPMSEGKKNIIAGLLQEYDIKTAIVIHGVHADPCSFGVSLSEHFYFILIVYHITSR